MSAAKTKKPPTKSNHSYQTRQTTIKNKNKVEEGSQVSKNPTKKSTKKVNKKKNVSSPSMYSDPRIPSIPDIIEQRRKNEEIGKTLDAAVQSYKDHLAKIAELDRCIMEIRQEVPEDNENKQYNTCRHLSIEEVAGYVKNNTKYIDDLFHGRILSERYTNFKLYGPKYMKNNISDVYLAFTEDQVVQMVTMFREIYDNGNRYHLSEFYYSVLIPEFGKKMLMDLYSMSYEQTAAYIKTLPIPTDKPKKINQI